MPAPLTIPNPQDLPLRADIADAVAFDGHEVKRADALIAAVAHLKGKGKSDDEIEDLTWLGNRLVVRAYWGGDSIGFVQKDYPGAVPVTVVNV